jgi:hypothetical protein
MKRIGEHNRTYRKTEQYNHGSLSEQQLLL